MKLSYRNQKNARSAAEYWGKPLEKPDWYEVKAQADEGAEILIYDVIGWPYNDAADLVRHIADLKGKEITARLNTPGGDVFDGIAIFNALKNHDAKVTIRVESLAASMGSVLAMAGREIQAYSSAMLMIHDPWVVTAGNQYELREVADILEKISGNILDIYTGKTKSGKKDMRDLMKAETWLTAKEAKERGFIDTIIEAGKPIKAQFDLSMFGNVPDGIEAARREATVRDRERALRDVGFSQAEAKAILAGRKGGGEGDQREVESCKSMLESLIQSVRRT